MRRPTPYHSLRHRPSALALIHRALLVLFLLGGLPLRAASALIGSQLYDVREFKVNTGGWESNQSPGLARLLNGNIVVAWHEGGPTECFIRGYSLDGTPVGLPVQISNESGWKYGPAMAPLPDGGLAVFYGSNFYKRCNDRLAVVGGGSYFGSANDGDWPAVAVLANTDLVVGAIGMYAPYATNLRLFSATLTPRGALFQANAAPPSGRDAAALAVASGSNGEFCAVWRIGSDILCRRFDATGKPLAAEFTVNSSSGGARSDPNVAYNSRNELTVVWTGPALVGSGTDLFMRRYSSGGVPLGSETQINQMTTGDQSLPNLAIGDNDSMVVTWTGPDGGENGVSGRLFDRNGQPTSDDFRVNQTTAGNQYTPFFGGKRGTLLIGDRIVSAWVKSNGTAPGVYLTILTPPNTAPVITSHPAAQIVGLGYKATFSVAATSDPAPNFQWRKDGKVLPGATNATLVLGAAQSYDAGLYDVVVTNVQKSVASQAAPLVVIDNSAVFGRLLAGSDFEAGSYAGWTTYDGTFDATSRAFSIRSNAWGNDARAVIGQSDWHDYCLELDFNLGANPLNSSSPGSILFGVQRIGSGLDVGQYYQLNIGPSQVAFVQVNNSGGWAQGLLTVNTTITAGVWHHLRLTIKGAEAVAWIDGREAIRYTHPSPFPPGQVGLKSINSATNLFDNVNVYGPNIFTGTYFGAFSGNNGNWSLIINPDGSGTYVAYLNNLKSGIVSNLQVTPDGVFRTLTTTLQPQSGAVSHDGGRPMAGAATTFTLAGSIGTTGVTGSLEGLNVSFTGAVDKPGGASAAVSGLYQASGGGVTTYAVVGPSQKMVALTIGSTLVDGGLGTVNSNGTFAVATTNNTQITGSIAATTGSIAATIAPPAGPVVTVVGASVSPQTAPTRLVNLSILADVPAAGSTFTLGYVVGGSGTTGTKPLVIRAVGPSLAAFGVGTPLADPKFELYTGTAKSGENDNWGGGAELAEAMTAVAAFPFAGAVSKDAAVTANLASGTNTVIVGGVGANTGSVLAEIYDATPFNAFTSVTPRLLNVSVLKEVGGGFTVGFVIGGRTTRTVLIRAVGPSLAQFGVTGALPDPRLTLFAGSTKVDENDNWGGAAALSAGMAQVLAFPLSAGSKDAALLTTLQPGNYSVQVAGVADATGQILVEVYEVP